MLATKRGRIALIAGAYLALGMLSVPGKASAGEINWDKYMRSGSVVSSIAAAVSQVDGCSKPLLIEETKEGNRIRLSFTCNGREDEEGTAIIEFESFEDGVLVPSRFLFAG